MQRQRTYNQITRSDSFKLESGNSYTWQFACEHKTRNLNKKR